MLEPKQINCSDIYSVFHGYDCDGGLYDSIQKFLEKKGWVYQIATDSWIKKVWLELGVSNAR